MKSYYFSSNTERGILFNDYVWEFFFLKKYSITFLYNKYVLSR